MTISNTDNSTPNPAHSTLPSGVYGQLEPSIRPSLDAFVHSVCSAIRVRGHLGRKLPIRDTSADAEAARFQMAVVR